MSYTLCLKCHTIDFFNPCGHAIVICPNPNCRHVFNAHLSRLPDGIVTLPQTLSAGSMTMHDIEQAHWPTGVPFNC